MSEYFVETQNMVEMDVAVEDNNLDMDASANQNVPMTTDQTTRVIEAISPTAEVTRVEGGAKITITDKNGTTEATINDGQDGTDGEKGDQGDPGPMPDFSIGNVSTGAPGSDASVTITGTPAEPYLNFTIPRGDKGEDGGGIPSGGTTGQFLKKASTTDFDVEWDSVPDPTNKADKVSGATSGNFAGLDSNGNLTDSGHKHSDYLTQHQDISGKADKVSSATSGNFAGLDGNGNLTDSGSKASDFLTQHQDISGKLDKPVTAGTSGQVLTSDGAGGQTWQTPSGGTVTDVQEDGTSILSSGVANILTMTGASSSSAGTKGLVPAPSSGDQAKVLTGGGTWQESPGAKAYVVELAVTNTSGSYTTTVQDENITASMKAVELEVTRPYVFGDAITVTPANGSYTVSCPNVSGTDTIKISFLKVIADPTAVTSTEFDLLNNRITAIENTEALYSVTIQTSDWSASPYTYTWTNSDVTADCSVEIGFLDGADDCDVDFLGWEKVSGGIEFSVDTLPTVAIPVVIKLTNARAKYVEDLTADMVATDAVSGASNVDEALETLDESISTINSALADYETLNGKDISASSTDTVQLTSAKALSHYAFVAVTASFAQARACYVYHRKLIDDLTGSSNTVREHWKVNNSYEGVIEFVFDNTSVQITNGLSATVHFDVCGICKIN